MTFEWDSQKAELNAQKHGVDFDAAVSVFWDPFATTYPDLDHSAEELREITIGYTLKADLLFVSHCQRGARIRMIGARRATKAEREQYEEGTTND